MHLDFWRNIEAILFKVGETKRWLARISGLNYQSLIDMMHRNAIPRLDTAKKLAVALDTSIDDLVNHHSGGDRHYDSVILHRMKLRLERSQSSIRHVLSDLEEQLEHVEKANHEHTVDEAPFSSDDALPETQSVPLVEDLAAGNPRSLQYAWDMLSVPIPELPRHVAQNSLVAFRLKGASMIDAGFGTEDIIFAIQDKTAENGDLVIAYVDILDGCTFKRLHIDEYQSSDDKTRHEYRLCWEDGSKKTHVLDPRTDWIIGVYVGKLGG